MVIRMIVLLTAGLVWSVPVCSHHNVNAHYNVNERITIEGVVTKFELINPHARIIFNVTNESGDVERWLAEGESHGVLVRQGWEGDELKPGDQITIMGRPARDSSKNLIQWITITKPDGTQLGDEEPRLNRYFEDLRRRQVEERGQSN